LCLFAGVSVVEDLDKAREPLPLAAVYFITPSPAAVSRLLADFATKPLYPSVHVFFSNRASADAVDRIKKCKVSRFGVCCDKIREAETWEPRAFFSEVPVVVLCTAACV
jgi:hypothetical protein